MNNQAKPRLNSNAMVAIVGRPNVGKSALFNRLTGERKAIVEDTPGITRDRIYGTCEWNGRTFTVCDTGGIDPNDPDILRRDIHQQAQTAVDESDLVLFVVDIRPVSNLWMRKWLISYVAPKNRYCLLPTKLKL